MRDSHPYEDLILGMIEMRKSRRAAMVSGLAWVSPICAIDIHCSFGGITLWPDFGKIRSYEVL